MTWNVHREWGRKGEREREMAEDRDGGGRESATGQALIN